MPHIHEKIDFTVSVFVVYKNKVLIRKHDKYKVWLGVGGHIELNEDPNQAAIREVKEEVGLDVVLWGEKFNLEHHSKGDDLIPPRFMNRHFINDKHEHVDMIYFATSENDLIIPEHPDDESEWLTSSELDNPRDGLSSATKLYAKTALEEVSVK